jgi:serine/threonine protein phosphatase PrpC
MLESYRGQQWNSTGRMNGVVPAPQTSMLDIQFAELSDVGRIRPHNEDYLGHFEPDGHMQARSHGWLFVLADGVGGHEKGEVASHAAVESMLKGFKHAPKNEPLAGLLHNLVQAANARVFEVALETGPSGAGMATTLVACALRYDRVTVAHVGDSRCYLIRQGKVALLTDDHTVVNEQVKLGLLSAQEAAEGENRHILSRSLGTTLFVGVETSETVVLPGDVLLLCSDGLHSSVTPVDIARTIAGHPELKAAAQSFVELANQRDGNDNISVQLIRVRSVERVGMYRGRPYKLR